MENPAAVLYISLQLCISLVLACLHAPLVTQHFPQVVAVICCMAGMVMMSYAESPEEEAQAGQILTLSAAAVTASNEVIWSPVKVYCLHLGLHF